ncbi:MAG: hypothetical protein H6P99_368 [Holophagaceae bacterium]|nr:hypothetical protein [Holophagaceae bacterium]
MSRAAVILLLLSAACVREDRAALHRRPIAPAPASGWARVPLDAAAQRQLDGAWIGDAAGRSIPFLEAREGLWEARSLPLENVLTGKDGEGRPTVEFTLRLPEGWRVGERETLRLDLDLEGRAPWVAQVKAERQREGGGFIAYDPPSPLHLFDLSPSGHRQTLDLPWDGHRYRLTLLAAQGEAPRIRGLSARAEARPEALETELALDGSFAPESGRPRTWRVTLADSERVVGLDLELAPPAAPLHPGIRIGGAKDGDQDADREWFCGDLVWNLPALGTRSSRLAFAPVQAKTLTVSLPEGATPQRVRILVRRQTLIFPAEAGQAYALHLGGLAKPAPGSLGALPSIRTLATTAPLELGPSQPDDQGLPRREGADQRARPWMPWVAAAALLGLGYAAWRLFRSSSS